MCMCVYIEYIYIFIYIYLYIYIYIYLYIYIYIWRKHEKTNYLASFMGTNGNVNGNMNIMNLSGGYDRDEDLMEIPREYQGI